MTPTVSDTRFIHSSLVVNDIGASIKFMKQGLGFQTVFGPAPINDELGKMTGTDCGQSDLVQLARDKVVVELIQSARHAAPDTGAVAHIAFEVPDLDRAIEQARTAGAEQLGQITTFSEGRSVYIREPGGVTIELEELFA